MDIQTNTILSFLDSLNLKTSERIYYTLYVMQKPYLKLEKQVSFAILAAISDFPPYWIFTQK